MAQTVEIVGRTVERPKQTATQEQRPNRGAQQAEQRKLESFEAELRKMTPEERIRASRYTMKCWEYFAYARQYPDEVPTVNGELERIALSLE